MAKYAKKLWDNLETEYSEVIYFRESFLNFKHTTFLIESEDRNIFVFGKISTFNDSIFLS